MRIALFGQSGQVATEVRRRAPRTVSLEVVGRDRADFERPEMVYDVARALNADAIVNAAAYTAVDRAETETERADAVNGYSVGALARAGKETGTPVVHLSTDYVFDGAGQAPHKPDEPSAPLGAYGRSKLLGEDLLRSEGSRHVILRTSWVFSAHGTNFVRTMLRLGSERDRLSVVADQVGGPTPAADIADAVLRISVALVDGRPGGTYHYAGTPDISWAGFAREIFRQAGLATDVTDIPTAEYPTPARRPLNSRLDCGSLMTDFGIARPEWRRGLADVLKELGIP